MNQPLNGLVPLILLTFQRISAPIYHQWNQSVSISHPVSLRTSVSPCILPEGTLSRPDLGTSFMPTTGASTFAESRQSSTLCPLTQNSMFGVTTTAIHVVLARKRETRMANCCSWLALHSSSSLFVKSPRTVHLVRISIRRALALISAANKHECEKHTDLGTYETKWYKESNAS